MALPGYRWGPFSHHQNKGSLNRLLARGVPSGDIKQLIGGVWLITIELIQQGMTHCARLECQDDISINHP
jgi:hypothetical protein